MKLNSTQKEKERYDKNLLRMARAASNDERFKQVEHFENVVRKKYTTFPPAWSNIPRDKIGDYLWRFRRLLPERHNETNFHIFVIIPWLIKALRASNTSVELYHTIYDYYKIDRAFAEAHDKEVWTSIAVDYDKDMEKVIKYVNEYYPEYVEMWKKIESDGFRKELADRVDRRLEHAEKYPVNLRPSRFYGEETRAPKRKRAAPKKHTPAVRVNVRKMF